MGVIEKIIGRKNDNERGHFLKIFVETEISMAFFYPED